MKKADVIEFFSRLEKDNPEPEGELNYVNTYTLLVAVVLSAQATDIGVNKATAALFERVTTPEEMVELGLEDLKGYIKTIGLYNSKAKNVISLSEDLIAQHNSIVPDNMEDLIKLAGVGRKTANVVLNMAFGQHTMAVDTHIFRIGNRTGLAPAKTVDKVEQKLLKVIPDRFMLHAHHWLILQGRYICKARKPECSKCLVTDLCSYKDKVFDEK